ncbi:hypothetical protein RB653_008974 [Dictyostelium firmibasis]|uniref:Uncharacterized protein n=1 Tax=Dictyostelium firmibasis TaxID=79012 RepID=A0AAN7U102_9MYCE
MDKKIISILISIFFLGFVKSGYIHSQIFSDDDGKCTNMLIGSFALEGTCIDSLILSCSLDLSSVIAWKYENSDCLGDPIGNQSYTTGGCVFSSSMFECTDQIYLPQNVNSIITVRHNSTEEECLDYKQGLVQLSYIKTSQCTPNVIKPNKYSFIQTCDESSITQVNYQSINCKPSTKTNSNSSPLPNNNCMNSTDYLSSYQFCYIPNF